MADVNESGLNVANNFNDVTDNVTKISDDEVTTAGVIYVGSAPVNSLNKTDEAIWAIKRIVKSVTGVTIGSVSWADGNTKPDNIWDNRASLTYN